MNNPIGFEQDPEVESPGTGTFTFEDGSSLYAMEPELASRLSLRGDKLAQNAPGDPAQAALLRRLQSAGPPPGSSQGDAFSVAPAASGVSMPAEAADESSLPAHMRMASPAAPPPAPMGPPLPPGGAPAPAPVARKPPPRPMVHYAGRDPAAEAASAVAVPTKGSTTFERTGAPYDPEMAWLREQANQAVVQAKMAEFDTLQARHMDEAATYAARLPALEQQATEQRAAADKLKSAALKERNRVHKHIADYDQMAKVDPGQIFKAGYGFPALAMVIGQSLGAYAAVLGGGSNHAQVAATEIWNNNLEAQRENIRQGRIGNDNMLAKLENEMGDAEQAESAWKLMHHELLDREIKAYSAVAQSTAVDQAAQVWLAQNQQARLLEEQKFMDLSIGKQTQTVSSDMVTPRRGGSRPMTDAELENQQIKDNERGVRLAKSENELGYELKGGKYAAEDAPNAELYVEGYGQAKSKKEAIILRSAIAEYQAGEKELDRASQLNKDGWAAVGADLPFLGPIGSDEYTEAQQIAQRSKVATARSFGGPITESDLDQSAKMTPDPTRIVGNQDVRIETARKANRDRLNEQIRAIVSGAHPELPDARREEERE